MAAISLLFLLSIISSRVITRNSEKREICADLNCDNMSNISVCGIRNEESVVRLKLFENECALLNYGCSVEDNLAYGLIGIEYCKRLQPRKSISGNTLNLTSINVNKVKNKINNAFLTTNFNNNTNCIYDKDCSTADQVCGIRQEGNGYRVKLFQNQCDLLKSNCFENAQFIQTDMFICEGSLNDTNGSLAQNDFDDLNPKNIADEVKALQSSKSIIVVDASMLDHTNDINDTIDNFFAATHVLDLPIKQIDEKEIRTRRMLLKNAAAVKVFTPWITIPKKILTDIYHLPTLSTCYHKCPTKCPDTYAPVCGVPGIKAREPSIMFQNHCYMDVAQCKMFWENKSSTATSSAYIESSFLFCLGDQLNGMYRFLPLIKTLQHMGRLKKKGRFHYKLKNMRFFNNLALREPKLMG